MTLLRIERDGPVALVTLNRPERLNALNRRLLTALDATCADLASDREVRAIVVTGAGERAFCAGADVNELDGIGPVEAQQLMRDGQGTFDRLAALPQPVIAAVNGVAFGGGCELALACDLRFLSDDALIGQPEIKLANVPGWGGTQRLPRLVGPGRAAEMILSGDAVDAPTALSWGLANRVHPADGLVQASVDYATRLARHAPLALELAKRCIAYGLENGLKAGLLFEAKAVARCCATEEQDAAIRAFLERRARRPAPASHRNRSREGEAT